ncbi:MAG: major capsid protein [Microthrixaceae bacterium]
MDTENTENEPVEEIEEIDYATLTEDELRLRHAELGQLIEDLRGQPATVEIASIINDLRAERNLIVSAVRELRSQLAESEQADDDLTGLDPATVTDQTEEAVVTDPINDEAVAAAEEVVAEMAVAASVTDRPVAPVSPEPVRVQATFLAGANQNAHTQGMPLDMDGLAAAFQSRQNLQPSADGRQTRAVVAGLAAFDQLPDLPVPVLSNAQTARENDAVIADAVEDWKAVRRARLAGEPLAKTAAICDPLDIIREIPEVGVEDTPFADLFPQRPVGRLGFTYTPASSIVSTNDGIAVWTEDDQAAVDPDDASTWKPCVEIECSAPTEVKAKELTTCATVDSWVEISSPERVREFLHLMRVQRARRREQHVLTIFDTTASGYTFSGTYGATPSLVQAILTLFPQLVYPEREDQANYDLVIEPGHLQKLTYDEHNKGFVEPEEVLAKIRAATGLNPVVLRDFKGASPFQTPRTPGASAAVLAEIPDTNRVRIVPAGAYIYGATGEESTGWQTDPQLVRQNKKQVFSAEWLMLAKHSGADAAYIDITSVGNGARANNVTAFTTGTYSGS